ncbi:MAG TPA: hypothetical protein VJ904_05610, partial [Tichowtungia sp.]|nr:hypothetical protein [Tichowtungia sp.]
MMEPNRENPVGENCEAADRMGAFDRVPDRHSPGDDGQAASGSERSVSLKYHERPDRISITGTFLNSLKLHVPEDWTITLGVWWTNVIPKNRADLPKQGFKIHVSAIPENAEEILKASLGVLLRREVQFKVLTGPEILLEALSKNHDRGASGKFMTIYPADDDQFRSLLRELHEATREFSGPYILSDMQYGDNGVLYYRYGSFVPRYWILPGGSRQYLIESPAGELVPDERNPFYSLPEWVEEPFDG